MNECQEMTLKIEAGVIHPHSECDKSESIITIGILKFAPNQKSSSFSGLKLLLFIFEIFLSILV